MYIHRIETTAEKAFDICSKIIDKEDALWIQLSLSGEYATGDLQKLVELCNERQIFLVVENDLTLLEDIKCHGIHLTNSNLHPAQIREKLGAEPIIGCNVLTPTEVLSLKSADIDYVTLPSGKDYEWYKNFSSQVKNAKVDIHLVTEIESFNADLIDSLIEAGIDGVVINTQNYE